MPYSGKISSYDEDVSAGMITAHNGGQAVMFFGGDVKEDDSKLPGLVGRAVVFDMVQTAKGAMAVNITLDTRSAIRPGDTLATLVTPFLILGTGYYLYEEMFFSPLIAYLAAVNLIAFILLICQSSRGIRPRTSSSEILTTLLAAGGGAVSIFFASALVPCRWRTETGRFALFAMSILHLFVLNNLEPGLLSRDFSAHLYRSSESVTESSSLYDSLR